MPLQSEADRNAYYESDNALECLSNWYSFEKEEAFIDFVFAKLRLPLDGLIVEIGGGAGIHGRILARQFGSRYLFTDISTNFVEAARNAGLPAARMDGLATTLDDETAACAVLVAPSTLLHDVDTRQRQFCECARILKPDGVAVFETTRWSQLHLWDRDDAEFLHELGFSLVWRNWGIIPGRLWSSTTKSMFRLVERVFAKTNIPIRSLLIARKIKI